MRIPIQSISDIITNSSSEVFCRIESENYQQIHELFSNIFRSDGYYSSEDNPTVYIRDLEDEKDYLSVEAIKTRPEHWVEIDLPYSLSEQEVFYRAGIEALLNQSFPGDYKITYEE